MPHMTDEQVWAILTAPDDLISRQLAEQLDLPYSSVLTRRWALRKYGWSCRISWDPCQECGKPLIRTAARKRYHDHCQPLVKKRLNASYVPDRRERMTQEQRANRDRLRDEHYERTQARTLQRATSHYCRYAPDEDELLIELSETMTIEQVALEVGRTSGAVQTRLKILRKRDEE